ncbi:hypothetical protein NDA13_006417 [Ustilago tritici]|nr:hypothetical protein NDA13_006417 [Ustilago tritici]
MQLKASILLMGAVAVGFASAAPAAVERSEPAVAATTNVERDNGAPAADYGYDPRQWAYKRDNDAPAADYGYDPRQWAYKRDNGAPAADYGYDPRQWVYKKRESKPVEETK